MEEGIKIKIYISILLIMFYSSISLSQTFRLESGKILLLIIVPDSVKTDLSPSDVIEKKIPIFEYFIDKNNNLLDGVCRRNISEYSFPDNSELLGKEINLYRVNKIIDSLIIRFNKFCFFKTKTTNNSILGINYLLLELELDYYKLNIGKRFCDPLFPILDRPSGFIIKNIIKSNNNKIKIPNYIRKKLINNYAYFLNFLAKNMWCYYGLN